MSSNSNNTPLNESKIDKTQAETKLQDNSDQEPTSPRPEDYETVHRSGIDVLTHHHHHHHCQSKQDTIPIPSLPCDLPFETIVTKYTDLIDLHNSIANYFDEHETATCTPDEDPRYTHTKFYGTQLFNDEKNNTTSRIAFMINVFRNDHNDGLHLDVIRTEGCGIKFACFLKSFADVFAVNKMDIWTFTQPHLCVDKSGNVDHTHDTPIAQ